MLRTLARDPAARNLADDAAVLAPPLGNDLVATHDMLAEGVHFTADCPPADIGWKLAAVNLSDLAAMAARPLAALFGAGIGHGRDARWAAELARGLADGLAAHGCALVGGDTIRSGPATVLSLTALGHVPAGTALSRGGAKPGDELWVSGHVGDAGLGLAVAQGRRPANRYLLARYRRPTPRLALGLALRPYASACIDVSDGLLLDAGRLAAASGVGLSIELAALPLSKPARESGVPPEQLAAMGDDYELLFTAPAARAAEIAAAARAARVPVTRIGRTEAGADVRLFDAAGHQIPLPERPGHLHC